MKEGREKNQNCMHTTCSSMCSQEFHGGGGEGRGGGILESKNDTGRCKKKVLESQKERVKGE